MRESIFRFLSGLIAVLYVLAKLIRPPAVADLVGKAGMAALVAIFAAYKVKGNRCSPETRPAAQAETERD